MPPGSHSSPMSVLSVNCGSSSIKLAVFETHGAECLFRIQLDLNGRTYDETMTEALNQLFVWSHQAQPIEAIGHRIVHGGEIFQKPTVINQEVIDGITSVSSLAPLHNPIGLLGIKRLQEAFPEQTHVAVFDTAFHQTLPERAYLYAIPQKLYRDYGVRRYGFHGLSHRFVSQEAEKRLSLPPSTSRIITAHLGNGCSACAVLAGKSIETTMGLSPSEGLVMGTRSGDVDPGLHSFLAEKLGLDLSEIQSLLNNESGLLGLSELSSDVRELEAASDRGHAQASLALEIFAYRLARQIAGLCVPLNGLDALVFAGGIGENSSRLRQQVAQWLSHLGLELDNTKNQNHGIHHNGIISTETKPAIMVIPTDEESLIARETAQKMSH